MLRSTLIAAINDIIEAISSSGIPEFLKTEKGEKRRSDGILNTYAKFIRSSAHFGVNENKIMQLLGIDFLNDPQFWDYAMHSAGGAEQLWSKVEVAMDFLPRFVGLIERSSAEESIKKKDGVRHNVDKVTVVLLEGSIPSSPERLTTMLKSIAGFYDIIEETELSGIKLSVSSCDSGSDKSFDFLGAAKVIIAIKEIILGIWDRIAFHREAKIGKELELIAKSLPIIEQISKMEKDGKIGKEKAEKLRRRMGDYVVGFVECGAIIPEMEEKEIPEPRLLMQPSVKLLAAVPTSNSEVAAARTEILSESDSPWEDKYKGSLAEHQGEVYKSRDNPVRKISKPRKKLPPAT